MKLDKWIPMAEAAELAGEPLRRFRRRMLTLNERHGGQLLKHFGRGQQRRHLHVSAEALLHHLRTKPAGDSAEIDALAERIAQLEAQQAETAERLSALRVAFQRRTRQWLARQAEISKTT